MSNAASTAATTSADRLAWAILDAAPGKFRVVLGKVHTVTYLDGSAHLLQDVEVHSTERPSWATPVVVGRIYFDNNRFTGGSFADRGGLGGFILRQARTRKALVAGLAAFGATVKPDTGR